MSRPLHVAVGAIAGTTGGPATYIVQLVRALAGLDDAAMRLTVLTDRPDLFGGIDTVELPLPSAWHQPWWDNVAVPRALRGLGADVYHGSKHALPLLGVPAGVASVVTIHDLAVLVEPETFSLAQRLQLVVHLRHAARSGARVVCVSEHAAGDCVERLGIERARITVVPHGIASCFRPPSSEEERRAVRERWGLRARHLAAFVGTAQPRKRIEVAVAAVEDLRRRGMDLDLVIAGRRRPGYEPDWLTRPPSFVRLLGEIDEAELVDLYGAADVMVSPSTFEGFGLTFVEAMACGCPVVGVAATSVPEVVGDGGILVEAAEPVLVAQAIADLVSDPDEHRRASERALARAARLSWRRAAEQTREVYRAAAGRSGEPAG